MLQQARARNAAQLLSRPVPTSGSILLPAALLEARTTVEELRLCKVALVLQVPAFLPGLGPQSLLDCGIPAGLLRTFAGSSCGIADLPVAAAVRSFLFEASLSNLSLCPRGCNTNMTSVECKGCPWR